MRTRRSPRNQEMLWKLLGRVGITPTSPVVPRILTDREIDALAISKSSRALMKRDAQRARILAASRKKGEIK